MNETIIKGSAWTANVSRLSYDDTKQYVAIIKEQGRPLLDDELNFMQFSQLAQMRKALSAIAGDGSPDAGFSVLATGAVNDFTVKAGRLLVDGWINTLANDTTYGGQAVVQAPLTTPGANRVDTAYADIWLDEVSAIADPTIIDPILNIRTSTRIKLFWAVKIAEGVGAPVSGMDVNNLFHWTYPLAQINRLAGNATITTSMVTDLRKVVGDDNDTRTTAVTTTLLASDGQLYANPAEGGTILIHMPTYGTVHAKKKYRVKNIGQGIAYIDTTDGTNIDEAALIELAPGDRCHIAKDGTNWQTI